ncbi:MAG: pantetheine-phosphate adenylyltransferase [Bacteroidota bacterium]|jgi:pantetheine-phosphate adenylyltransferase
MTKPNIALFPGSFDPFTKGHASIVEKALGLFDKVVIGIGENAAKQYFYSLEDRKKFISRVYINQARVEVVVYTGLTIEACREHGAKFILRGLRNSADFGFERNIAQMNHAMNPGVETVFLVTDPELSAISSTIIREIIKHGGNAKPFVPEGMLD